MAKYTKGWLCRSVYYGKDSIELFFSIDPVYNSPCGWSLPKGFGWKLWPVGCFKATYDCDFTLPKSGEKVEIEIEL